MNEVRMAHFICWVIVLILVWASWEVESEKAARVLLGVAIQLTFIYASYYGGTMH